MSSPCRALQSALVCWSRSGSGSELPEEVRLHAQTCAACSALLDEVLEPRRLVEELPVRRVKQERLGEIRFALMAAARRSAPCAEHTRPRAGLGRHAWLAAAVLVLLTGVLVIALPHDGNEPPSRATITLSGDAEGLLVGSMQDQVYLLVRGRADFDIAKLSARERFRVFAMCDVIEVRGTRFTVQVQDRGLDQVSVDEGRVLVTLDKGRPLDLRGGDRWRRALPAAKTTAHEHENNPELLSFATPEKTGDAKPSSTPVASRTTPSPAVLSRGVAPSASAALSAPGTNNDALFRRAWQLYNDGEAAQAAALLDEMARDPNLDEARRVDVLFWSAKAHAQLGNTKVAEERARSVVERQPNAWHAAESALMLGEALLREGKYDEARKELLRAASSPRPSVRSRALELLRTIPPGGVLQPTPD